VDPSVSSHSRSQSVPFQLIHADRIRRQWGDKASLGGVDGSRADVRSSGGLEIIYLREGQTMTPVCRWLHAYTCLVFHIVVNSSSPGLD
jgi:hypothetical protein